MLIILTFILIIIYSYYTNVFIFIINFYKKSLYHLNFDLKANHKLFQYYTRCIHFILNFQYVLAT